MPLQFQAVGGVELAIDMGMQQLADVSAVHTDPF